MFRGDVGDPPRVGQGESRRAAERAVTFGRALVSSVLPLQLRGDGVNPPASEGNLEALLR